MLVIKTFFQLYSENVYPNQHVGVSKWQHVYVSGLKKESKYGLCKLL